MSSLSAVMPGPVGATANHQAIEAKENLAIQPETQTLASITYQNFFLLYPRSGWHDRTARPKKWNSRKLTSSK